MLPIYVCEDEKSIRQHISTHISDYYIFHPEFETPEIHLFSNPHQLLSILPEKAKMGIYLLDIQLNSDINGLDLAREIRLRDPRGFIVFITAYDEYAPKTFQLQLEVFNYIDKNNPNLNAALSLTLSRIHERYALFQGSSLNNPRIEFECNRHIYYYFANDIIAITTSEFSHRIKLFTMDKNVDFNGTLSSVKQQLPSSHFMQCHRAYIINKHHVKSYDSKTHTLVLSNHMQIPVSRENRNFFRQDFLPLSN